MFILKRIVLLSAIVISSNSFSATTNKSMVDNDLHDSPNPDLLMAIDMAMAIRSHHNQLTINPTVRELLKLKIINSSMIQDNKTYTYFNTEFIINKSKISYKNINKKNCREIIKDVNIYFQKTIVNTIEIRPKNISPCTDANTIDFYL